MTSPAVLFADSMKEADAARAILVPGSACWICLDDTSTKEDPLRRSCACRGSSGFAHVSCLIEYASKASKEAYEKGERADGPWTKGCPFCLQQYEGKTRIALLEAFLEESKQIPDNNISYSTALFTLADAHSDSGNCECAIQLFEHALDVLRHMPPQLDTRENRVQVLKSNRVQVLKALATCYIGISNNDKALLLLEEAKQLVIDLYGGENTYELKEINTLIDMLRSINYESHNVDVPHDLAVEMLKEAKENHGRESQEALNAMSILVFSNYKHGNFSKAAAIMNGLLDTSKRVFGADHSITLRYGKMLLCIQADLELKGLWNSRSMKPTAAEDHEDTCKMATLVGFEKRPDLNGKTVEVLRSSKKGNKYILKVKFGTTFMEMKAPVSNVVLATGTEVLLKDLVSESHLNGSKGIIKSFDEAKRRYEVASGAKGGKLISVKPENCHI